MRNLPLALFLVLMPLSLIAKVKSRILKSSPDYRLVVHSFDCTKNSCGQSQLVLFRTGKKEPLWKSAATEFAEYSFTNEARTDDNTTFILTGGKIANSNWHVLLRLDSKGVREDFFHRQDYGFGYLILTSKDGQVLVEATYPVSYPSGTGLFLSGLEKQNEYCEQKQPEGTQILSLTFYWNQKTSSFKYLSQACVKK